MLKMNVKWEPSEGEEYISRNKRETFIRGGLQVKTAQLIQFLPVQMLLLNPRNITIVSESEYRENGGPSVVAEN